MQALTARRSIEMDPDHAESVAGAARNDADVADAPNAAPGKALSEAARRALAEAAARREAQAAREAELAREREVDGRGGLDPVRYDDWEIKGLTTDF